MKIIEHKLELSLEEMVYYGNFCLVDFCDCCGDYFPITNRNDGDDYLTLIGNQLLCRGCLN